MYDEIAKWILSGRLPKDLSDISLLAYKKMTYRVSRPPAHIYDGDAVILIRVLAERGYKTILESYPDGNLGYGFQITKGEHRYSALQPTVAEAICSALVGIIYREAESI